MAISYNPYVPVNGQDMARRNVLQGAFANPFTTPQVLGQQAAQEEATRQGLLNGSSSFNLNYSSGQTPWAEANIQQEYGKIGTGALTDAEKQNRKERYNQLIESIVKPLTLEKKYSADQYSMSGKPEGKFKEAVSLPFAEAETNALYKALTEFNRQSTAEDRALQQQATQNKLSYLNLLQRGQGAITGAGQANAAGSRISMGGGKGSQKTQVNPIFGGTTGPGEYTGIGDPDFWNTVAMQSQPGGFLAPYGTQQSNAGVTMMPPSLSTGKNYAVSSTRPVVASRRLGGGVVQPGTTTRLGRTWTV